MSLRESIRMGMDAYQRGQQLGMERDRIAMEQQRAERERDLFDRQTQEYNGLVAQRKAAADQYAAPDTAFMFGDGLNYPAGPEGSGLDVGPPTRGVSLPLPQGYVDQSKRAAGMARIASAKDLYAMGDEQNKMKYFAQGQAISQWARSAPPEHLGQLAADISSDKRNAFKAAQGANGTWTLTPDNAAPIKLTKEQMADFLGSQHVYRNTGDESALKRIDSIHADLAAQVASANKYQVDVARIGNDAARTGNANANDNQRTANDNARLGLSRKQADAQLKRGEQEDWTPIAVSEDGKGLTVYNRRTHAMRNEPLPEGVDAHGLFAKLTGSRGQQGPVAVPEDGKMFYHPQLGTVTYYAGQAVAKGGVPDAGVQDALKEAKYDVNLVNDAVRQGLLKADPNGRGVIDRDGNTYSYMDKDDAKALNAKLREIATRTLEGEEGWKRHGDSGALERRYPTPPRDTRFAAPGATPYGLMPPPGLAVDPRQFQGK